MSSPDVISFSFPPKPPLPNIATGGFSLPSPPLSVTSDIPPDAFDLDSFVDLASTPQSTVLVSPKTAGVSPTAFSFDPAAASAAFAAAELAQQQQPSLSPVGSNDTADALSKHHFERYLHYRALATQAQADLALCFVDTTLMSADAQSPDSKDRNMLALQPPFMGGNQNQNFWNPQLFSYQQQQQQQVLNAQAQAQAHLQAAEVAQRMSIANLYMPSARTDVVQPASMWSRNSTTTSVSAASPPLPSTPNFTALPPPTLPFTFTSKQESPDLAEDDELDLDERKIPNLHGGGRGYVPGKTPDDPKKRHKCHVCGRGFARAFNLKSHVQTHDPSRPKPHQCPHPMCKRSFSRLHDLERHRQGIHSDGPLVDAKRQGVSPSVVRAQSRIQRRAETGGLI